jgi:hypothetical protein
MLQKTRAFGVNDRKHPRTQVTGKGTVVFEEGRFVIRCTVIDLSETGAQIRLPLGVAVPERFQLLVTGWCFAADCSVAWQKSPACGVRFIERHRLSALPPGMEYLIGNSQGDVES